VTDQRCPVTELPANSCDHRRSAGKPRRPVTARISGRIEARHRDQCRGCGEFYSAGVLLTPSDTDGWVAECCAGDGDA
jgi:hypothetical protein